MSTPDAGIAELRERVLAASASGAPLRLRGAGTKDFYGEALEGDVLELRSHHGIVSYEPSELVIRARAGTPLSQIEAALAAEGQFLAFEPPAFGGDPTIGGVIAAGLSGPRRLYAGAARDFVLGTRLLTGDGELLRFGGEVMKNVAGFDVSRLLCGSLGILGLITEVSLKVLPLPRAEVTVRLERAAREALEASTAGAQPPPISACAWSAGCAWVRFSGASPAVRLARERLGGQPVDEAAARGFWHGLRDCALPFFRQQPLWRQSLPSTAPLAALGSEPLIDWGGAVRWYGGVRQATDVRAAAVASGGTALCWRGQVPRGQRFHPLSGVSLGLHRRLKQRFDPRGIFNPNRLIDGL